MTIETLAYILTLLKENKEKADEFYDESAERFRKISDELEDVEAPTEEQLDRLHSAKHDRDRAYKSYREANDAYDYFRETEWHN